MTGILLDRVCAGYDSRAILDDLDLEVTSGELVAVLGASGSGKTTLLRTVTGFLRPSAGHISIGDHVVAGPSSWVPPEKRRIGIVPQEGALFPHLDVSANIAFGLRRLPPDIVRARVEELLALVGMSGMGSRRPQQLSGGQRQRIALARALAPRPAAICLDEPFAALDAALRMRLRTQVGQILRAEGTTVLLVTHDQQEALSMADRLAVIREGRIIQIGTPDRVYWEPADLGVARLVGDVVELPAERRTALRVQTALGPIDLDPGQSTGHDHGTVMLRPEQLTLGAIDGSAEEQGTGLVTAIAFQGAQTLVEVRVPGLHHHDGTVTLRTTSTPGGAGIGALPAVGSRVAVRVVGLGRLYP
jgi:iron(III) transport system ATP-binding protein